MLTILGLKNFYYLPTFHDMRCKASRVSEITRSCYHCDLLQGDVYILSLCGISHKQKYMTEIRKGRTDYENLLPMTICLTN